ncbi:MAG TPA: SBBP repeat-containing protein, partial [Bryobacteraceae bacterium]
MSKRSCISSTYLAIFISITLQAQNIRDHGQLGQIPLYFEENHGQAEAAVAFVARSSNLLAFVTHGGLVISSAGARISMRIAGADTHQQLHREGEVNGITNYYLGSKNVVGLTHYSAIRAEQVRPGIDVVYHGNGTDLEYDFLVHPRGSTANLRVLYDGAKHVAVSEAGEVILSTGTSEVHQKKPQAWQVVAGRRENVECHYVLSGRNEVRLVVGSYRRSSELIIDPILSYSTFLGGSKPDLADAVAVDFNGNAYVTGWTQSSDFPVTSGKLRGTRDVFVTELNSSGTALIYSTYIGGSTDQLPFGIALDGGGNAFITGETTSNNFPFTRGHYSAGQDAFVVELGPSGAITYATALGGSNDDAGAGIAVDSSGAAYVAGSTSSKDFPVTSHAFMTKLLGQGNAFVAKLTPSGAISYATFLGGKHFDGAGPIAVDSFGNAYVGGSTNSLDFPVTAGAFSTTNHGENDAFVTELNPDGTELKFSTLLGGSYSDGIGGIAVDSTGCYVTGFTFSGDFPTTPGAFATVKPSQPASYSSGFVTKLDPSGASLLYSTFLGGNNDDTANAIAIDSGSAYVAGEAWSANFPTTAGALRSRLPGITYSENDMFLSQISPDGSSLSYSTLFGATAYGASSLALAMAVDGKGGVYLVGPSLFSAGDRYEYLFPTTPGSFQEERPQSSTPAEESAAIVKIDFSSPTLCTPSISPQSQNLPSYGGSFSFNLTLAPGCPWEAIPDQ